jgi:hypothetical protein
LTATLEPADGKFVAVADAVASEPEPEAGTVLFGTSPEYSVNVLAVAEGAYCSVLVRVTCDVHGSEDVAAEDKPDVEVEVDAGESDADDELLTIVASVYVLDSGV